MWQRLSDQHRIDLKPLADADVMDFEEELLSKARENSDAITMEGN